MADDTAKVKVETESGAAADKLLEFGNRVGQTTKAVEGHFAQMTKAVEGYQTKLLTAFGLFAAGGIIGKAITSTSEMTDQAVKLSRQLGITTNEASVLSVALDDIYVSTDTYSSAAIHLTRSIRANEEAVKKMGVETRDSNGQFKNSQALMSDALRVMLQYKEGTDRNLASQTLFGRGAAETAGLLRLNADVMESAKEKAERLGLVIGADNVEANKAYKAAQNDLNDAFGAFTRAIGTALMPAFTQFIVILTNAAETILPHFKNAILGITIVFDMVKTSTIQFTALLVASFTTILSIINRVGEAIAAVLTGRFGDAKKAMSNMVEDIKSQWKEAASVVLQASADFSARTEARVLGSPQRAGTGSIPGGGDRAFVNPKEPKEKSTRMDQWRSELEQQKEATGSMLRSTLEMEEEFWKKKLVLARGNAKETRAVEHELFQVHKQQAQKQYEEDKASLQYQLEQSKNNWDARAVILRQEAELARKTYGDRSREHTEALRNIEREERQHLEFLRGLEAEKLNQAQASGKSRIDMERDVLQFQREFGIINGRQYIEAVRQLEQLEYQEKLAALQKKKELYKEDQAEKLRIDGEISAATRDHERSVQQSQLEMAREIRQTWRDAMSTVTNTVSTSVQGIVMGTQTSQQAVRNLGNAFLGMFIDQGVKMLSNWIATQLGMTAITQTQATARTATQVSANATAATSEVDLAATSITANAAKTGAGTWAAISEIPVVGPFIAPAMAAGAFMAAMAFMGKLKSAAGGYDIPSGINPMLQAHSEEMVLPKELANKVRNMTEGDSAGGSTFIVKALDSADVRRFLGKNGHQFAKNLVSQARNGRISGALR